MTIVIPFTGSEIGFFVRSPGSLGPPSSLLADNIDPDTNDFKSLFTGMDVIDSQVIVAVTYSRASGSAIKEDGIRITAKKIDESIRRQITSDVKTALSRLIRNGDIIFKGVDFGDGDSGIDRGNQAVNCLVKYVNARAMDSVTREVPVKFVQSEINV